MDTQGNHERVQVEQEIITHQKAIWDLIGRGIDRAKGISIEWSIDIIVIKCWNIKGLPQNLRKEQQMLCQTAITFLLLPKMDQDIIAESHLIITAKIWEVREGNQQRNSIKGQ